MRSYTASFGASIWTETSISSSQEMYFGQNKEGGTFRLVQFQSSDEAEQLYGALMRCRHPNLAHVLQFTVEEEGGFFLAFRRQGTSLKDILEKFVDVKKFYEDIRITPFYQKILIDLLLVVRHLMDTKVKCTLDLSDIYILDKGHVMMTNFKLRDCPSSISEWKELAVVVKAINENINYEANMEMNIFIKYLESENAKNFTNLSKLPLFWTPEERGLFPRAVWDFIKAKPSLSSVINSSPFEGSVNVFQNDPILRQLKQGVDNYESQFGKDPDEFSGFDIAETEVRNTLGIIRKCLSHFHKQNITSLGLKNEDEVAKYFEKSFKDYIGQLYKWALIFESSSQVKLLPQRTILSKLNKEP
ncbi:uncharacterized protein LOC114278122 isoform X2 [Camellia sinensis]|nr:uncharacterized protein LOC114278122 isoform X2 [Camellia sinensis]